MSAFQSWILRGALVLTLVAPMAWQVTVLADDVADSVAGVPKGPYSEAIRALVRMEHRPTIADLKEALRPWPEQNPFAEPEKIQHFNAFEEVLASAIADMEYAYPGLVYAPLGRDVVMLSDAIDAFYQAQGQFGRVRRLNASTPSFAGADTDRLVQFLKSSGFDIDHPFSGRPFIVFDYTSYSPNSQSTRVIRAGYEYFLRSHAEDVGPFLHKFNLVSFASGERIQPGFDLDAFFKRNEEHVRNHVSRIPRTVLMASPQQHGYMLYTTEWHQSFQGFVEGEGGRLIGIPGAQFPDANKRLILENLYEIIKRVQTPEFRALVDKKAEGLGYRFDPARSGVDSCANVFVAN